MDPQKLYERRWWTLAVLCLSLTVISIDNTILNVALPSIVESLGARGSRAAAAHRRLHDRVRLPAADRRLARRQARPQGHPHRRPRAVRRLLGVGRVQRVGRHADPRPGADGHRRRLHLPEHAVDPHQHVPRRPRAGAGHRHLGRRRPASASPSARSPAACCVEHFWWGSVFLVNVPICLVAIVAGRFFVPTTPRDPDHALDPLGAIFSIVGLIGPALRHHRGARPGLDLRPAGAHRVRRRASSSSPPSPGGRRTTSTRCSTSTSSRTRGSRPRRRRSR